MSVLYDDRAASTAMARPRGHFPDPHPEKQDFTVLYYAGSPGPEYWICVVKVIEILPDDHLKIKIFRRNGQLSPEVAIVNLNDLTQVWRRPPSTVNPVATQTALAANDCVILCVSERVVATTGIAAPADEHFGKHPWGGDDTLFAAFLEMATRLKDEIDSLPATSAAKRKYPGMFK